MALILSIGAAVSAINAIAIYQPKVRRNAAPQHPRFEQSLMIVALGLAISALILRPGIGSAILSISAMLPAALFLLGTTKSRLPSLTPNLSIGQKAPDFTVLDAHGEPFHLSDLRGTPILLKFYRGFWCPYCVAELEQLAEISSRFDNLGVKLVAISSDTVDELRRFEAKQDWNILLLADPALAVHQLYKITSRTFAPKRGPFRDLAVPTTILVGADGNVLWFELSEDFRVRPQAEAVFDLVRTLLKNEQRGEPHSRAASESVFNRQRSVNAMRRGFLPSAPKVSA
ncbi:MAG TPA: redoxin domain-containing protein [Sphingomicrobium sp.]|nr:redoxin domain-containing protein [Sphingomicrobium sp.]